LFGWETAICRIYGDNPIKEGVEHQSLHCLACNKTFMNESVFHYHKKGKRHIKAINALSKIVQAPSLEQSNLAKDDSKKG
jgi:hypothetical protein